MRNARRFEPKRAEKRRLRILLRFLEKGMTTVWRTVVYLIRVCNEKRYKVVSAILGRDFIESSPRMSIGNNPSSLCGFVHFFRGCDSVGFKIQSGKIVINLFFSAD